MDRNDVSWKGYWAACPTPYREDGELALDLLRALLEHYVEHGLHGVFINGTTGEWFSQTDAERREVARTAIGQVAGRIPIVIGCTDYTARAVIDLARHAVDCGADGIVSSPPAYSRPLDDEIVAFYEELAEALPGVPLMVYNWPPGTNVEIGPELALRLAAIDTIVAIKDSTGNFEQFAQTTRAVIDRLRVFGPFMSTAGYALLEDAGGDGFVGGGAILDGADPAFWEAHWRGDRAYCQAHAARTDRIFDRLWLPGGWRGRFGHYQSQLKAIMAIIGQPGGTVRRPRLPVTDPEALRELREILIEERILTGQPAPHAGTAV